MIVEPVVQATASGTAVRLQDTAQKGDWLTPEEAAWGIGAMIVSNSGRLCSLSHSRRVWSRDGLAAAGSHQEACTVAATSLRDGDVYSDAQNDLQVW